MQIRRQQLRGATLAPSAHRGPPLAGDTAAGGLLLGGLQPADVQRQQRRTKHTKQQRQPSAYRSSGSSRPRRDQHVARAAADGAAAYNPEENKKPSVSPWQQQLLRLVPDGVVLYWPVIKRLLVTIGMLAIIRMGYFIPLPGVDMAALPSVSLGATEGDRMVRALYGQASELPASLFDLGIIAHINAGILISMILMLPKHLLPFRFAQRLREARKEGKAGEAFINDKINWMAFVFAIYASCLRAFELAPYALGSTWFVPATMVALMGGAFMLQYCANTITAHGMGNGSTLVICTGIITEYSDTIHKALSGLETAALQPVQLALVAAGYLGLVLFTVYLATTQVRLPIIQYSTHPAAGLTDTQGRQALVASARQLLDRKAAEAGRQSSHFPILLNSSGIMPMIFASAAWYGLLPRALELMGLFGLADYVLAVQAGFAGLLVYGLLVFCLEFLPFGGANPEEVSEFFGMINVGIKGVPPGPETVAHLRKKVRQAKFWGGLALAGLAVTAHLFDALCAQWLGTTLATTSLVIIVGAVLQTSRQLESTAQGPKLQRQLEQERGLIGSLAFL